MLEDLNEEFQGIMWDEAFKTCSSEELNKFIFSTGAAGWILDLVEKDI